jgi:hypothetical protein
LLVGCGTAVNLATLFRFDAVLWGPIAGLLLLVPPGRILPRLTNPAAWRAVALLALVCAIYPICLAIRWHQLHGDPLHFFHTAQADTARSLSVGRSSRLSTLAYQLYTLIYWPSSSFLILTPLLAGIAYVGLLRSLAVGKHGELAIGYVLFTLWLMYSAYNHTILCQFRYTLILQALLLAYAWPGAHQVLDWFPRSSGRVLWTACGVIGIATYIGVVGVSFVDAGSVARGFRSVSPVQRFPYASRFALDWIRNHVEPGETVLVMPNVTSPYFALSGAVLKGGPTLVRLSTYRREGPLWTRDEFIAIVRDYLSRTTYVLLNTAEKDIALQDGMYHGPLISSPDFQKPFEEHGREFLPEAEFGSLRIYRVGRPLA